MLPCTCPGVGGEGCPCGRCHGSGWYPHVLADDDYLEAYCDCEAGKRLRERDGGKA